MTYYEESRCKSGVCRKMKVTTFDRGQINEIRPVLMSSKKQIPDPPITPLSESWDLGSFCDTTAAIFFPGTISFWVTRAHWWKSLELGWVSFQEDRVWTEQASIHHPKFSSCMRVIFASRDLHTSRKHIWLKTMIVVADACSSFMSAI